MRALGWTVDAASSGATSDPALASTFESTYEIPFTRSIRAVRSLVAGERAMERLLLDVRPDIVHVHTPIASFVTRVAARRMPAGRRPTVVYTAHGFHFTRNGPRVSNAMYLIAERVAGRWTDWLVVINDEDEAAARRHRLVRSTRIIRHPGVGLDTSHYAPDAVDAAEVTQVRARLGVGPDQAVFVVIGELNRNKRQADAIAALAGTTRQDAMLFDVGEGPLGTSSPRSPSP